MSHITMFKNKVPLQNKEWVNEALAILQRQYPGMTIKEYLDHKYVTLNNQNGYASLTLRWNQQEGRYIPQAMDTMGKQATRLQQLTDEIAVAYQQAGVQKWMQKNRFSSMQQQHEGGVIMNARRY